MKRIMYTKMLAILAMLLWSGSALAIDLAPGFNTIEFLYWENRIPVENGLPVVLQNGVNGGPISVGDRFYGVAQVQVIRGAPGQPNPFDNSSNPVHNLTGYFYNQVVNVQPADDPQNAIITLGVPTSSDPNGIISDAERANGVVFELYEDIGGTNPNLSSLPASLATMTDGALWMSLSMNNGYWWSEALLDPTGVGPGTFLGFSWFGLNLAGGQVNNLIPINDPREDLFDLNVHVYADATIETNARRDGSVGTWAFTGDDPATLATPEPATMLIMGSGLLGMFASRRRKKSA